MKIICFGYCEWGPNLHESGPQHWLKWCVLLILLLKMCSCVPAAYSWRDYDKKWEFVLVQKFTRNFKRTVADKQIRRSSRMTGVRIKLKWLFRVCWFLLPVSHSWQLDLELEPDSSDVQSLPHESDFTTCHRTFSPNIFSPQPSVVTAVMNSLFFWHVWIHNLI